MSDSSVKSIGEDGFILAPMAPEGRKCRLAADFVIYAGTIVDRSHIHLQLVRKGRRGSEDWGGDICPKAGRDEPENDLGMAIDHFPLLNTPFFAWLLALIAFAA